MLNQKKGFLYNEKLTSIFLSRKNIPLHECSKTSKLFSISIWNGHFIFESREKEFNLKIKRKSLERVIDIRCVNGCCCFLKNAVSFTHCMLSLCCVVNDQLNM